MKPLDHSNRHPNGNPVYPGAERDRLLTQFQPIMENISDALALADPSGRVVYHNPASLFLHGYASLEEAVLERDEVVPQWDIRNLNGQPVPVEDWPMPRVLRGDSFNGEELRVRRCDTGKEFIGSYNGKTIRNAGGEPMFAMLTIRDITEQKRAEERTGREHRETVFANRVLRTFIEYEGDTLFDRALAVVQEEMESKHGVFGYIAQPGHLICPSLSKMLDTCEIEGKCIHYPPEKWKGLWAKALTEKRSLYTNKASPVPSGHPMIHNNLATPILFHGEVIGLLNIANKDGGYTDADRDSLDRIAGRVAPVLYAWIQRKLREEERKAAEEALRESEERYRSLFEHMLNGFAYCQMLFDEHGRPDDFVYLVVNDAFGRLTSLKDVIGKRVTQVIPRIKELSPELFEIYGRVASTGNPERFEIDFKPLGLYLSISVFSPRNGYFVAVFDDITKRKAEEEERERLLGEVQAERDRISALVASMRDEVWFADTQKRFTLANPAAMTEFGLDKDEAVDVEKLAASLGVLRPDGSPRPIEEAPPLRALKGEVVTNQEEIIRTPASGALRYRQVSATPVRDKAGQIIGSVSVVRDITVQKRSEEELRKAKDELELRVAGRTAELRNKNEELERANRELEDFVHIASHDLQEPLRKIQTFSDRLTTTKGEPLDEKALDYLNRMRQSSKKMQALVLALLKFSKATSNKPVCSKFNLKEPIDEAISDLGVLCEEKEGCIEISELPEAEADRVQMGQLFQNLIGNSLKYRGEKKPVIRIYSNGSPPEGFLEIFVEDNGIGFEDRYLDKIFKPFQRLHGKDAGYEGTGMGLAICRKIVERHGGSITARSKPREGSTFIVRLPKKQHFQEKKQ